MINCSYEHGGWASEENCELLQEWVQKQKQAVGTENPWESLIEMPERAVVVQVLCGRV